MTGLKSVLVAASVAIVLGLAAASWRYSGAKQTAAPSESNNVTFGGPFTLVDHNGRSVTNQQFFGRYLIVFFGYTSCPAVCPTTLLTMSQALDQLGDGAKRVQPLFVSVDPERDTPSVLAEYIAQFDKRILGLTGSAAEIAAVARAFHVYYHKVPDDHGGYDIEHTATMYLMGPDGKFLMLIPPEASSRRIAILLRDRLNEVADERAEQEKP
jgi:protein SCO1/2